jgi:hypothetical protein
MERGEMRREMDELDALTRQGWPESDSQLDGLLTVPMEATDSNAPRRWGNTD